MLDHLSQISSDPERSHYFKCRNLCYTIAGNPVPLLTITSSSASLEESKVDMSIIVVVFYNVCVAKESCSCYS